MQQARLISQRVQKWFQFVSYFLLTSQQQEFSIAHHPNTLHTVLPGRTMHIWFCSGHQVRLNGSVTSRLWPFKPMTKEAWLFAKMSQACAVCWHFTVSALESSSHSKSLHSDGARETIVWTWFTVARLTPVVLKHTQQLTCCVQTPNRPDQDVKQGILRHVQRLELLYQLWQITEDNYKQWSLFNTLFLSLTADRNQM